MVVLPLGDYTQPVPGPVVHEVGDAAAAACGGESEGLGGLMRVLVVDDDSDQREMLRALISAWGHTVRVAADGEAALELVATTLPEVMVTDLQMPRMDGFELMERLRAEHLQEVGVAEEMD